MGEDQGLKKLTFLLDNFQIKGKVSKKINHTEDFNPWLDAFNIIPDQAYKQLIDIVSGSCGKLHCETYPLTKKDINKLIPWPLPTREEGKKYGETFTADMRGYLFIIVQNRSSTLTSVSPNWTAQITITLPSGKSYFNPIIISTAHTEIDTATYIYPGTIVSVDCPDGLVTCVVKMPYFEIVDKHGNVITNPDGKPVELKPDNHVKLTGRLVIENGHTDDPNAVCPGKEHFWVDSIPILGLGTWVGYVFLELHPFDYTRIELIDLQPNEENIDQVTVIAPIYDKIWDHWSTGARGPAMFGNTRAIYTETGWKTTVEIDPIIEPPPLPQGFTPHESLVSYRESNIENYSGFSQPYEARQISRTPYGIKVTAKAYSNDINNPAFFRASYALFWKTRLAASEIVVETLDGEAKKFELEIFNYGPDKIDIANSQFDPDDIKIPNSTFQLMIPPGTFVEAWSVTKLEGIFTPPSNGNFSGKLRIYNTDPVASYLSIPVTGKNRARSIWDNLRESTLGLGLLGKFKPIVRLPNADKYLFDSQQELTIIGLTTNFRYPFFDYYLPFLTTAVGDYSYETFKLTNNTTATILHVNLILMGSNFKISNIDSFPMLQLHPQESRIIQVRFAPSTKGKTRGILKLIYQHKKDIMFEGIGYIQ